MSVTGNKMRTDCSPCRRRFRYRRIRWDTWEQDRADAFESGLISSPRKWGLRVAHNALSLRQADRADSEVWRFPQSARSASRDNYAKDQLRAYVGFRVARTLTP